MLRPQGHAVMTLPDGKRVECDTFTCGHCQFIVPVPPRADASACGGFCRCCMRLICGRCSDKGTCTPVMKWIEEQERKDTVKSALGL